MSTAFGLGLEQGYILYYRIHYWFDGLSDGHQCLPVVGDTLAKFNVLLVLCLKNLFYVPDNTFTAQFDSTVCLIILYPVVVHNITCHKTKT